MTTVRRRHAGNLVDPAAIVARLREEGHTASAERWIAALEPIARVGGEMPIMAITSSVADRLLEPSLAHQPGGFAELAGPHAARLGDEHELVVACRQRFERAVGGWSSGDCDVDLAIGEELPDAGPIADLEVELDRRPTQPDPVDVSAMNSEPVGGSFDRVLGQRDTDANGEIRWDRVEHDSLCWPYGLSYHLGRLVIADSGNNRVIVWSVEP